MDSPFPAYKGDQPYIFVSYAHDDAELVYPEIIRLKKQGFNIWYDEGINPGASWRDELADRISRCDLFVYFVTPRSIKSNNCKKEVNYAIDHDKPLIAVHLEHAELAGGIGAITGDDDPGAWVVAEQEGRKGDRDQHRFQPARRQVDDQPPDLSSPNLFQPVTDEFDVPIGLKDFSRRECVEYLVRECLEAPPEQ